jgi:hypothetical protein
VTHPHQLHARAALWSMHATWPKLQAAQRAAAAADRADGDRGTLQAWRPGSGIHSAQHGDALLDAVIRFDHPGAVNPYAVRAQRAGETLQWIMRTLLGFPARDPLIAIQALLPLHLDPAAARNIAAWIEDEDRAARRLLGERTDHRAVPELACPHCSTVGALALRVSAPRDQRVAVCTAGCTCDGPGCGCGMGTEVQGVAHIWTTTEMEGALQRCSPTTQTSSGEPPPRSRPTSAAA